MGRKIYITALHLMHGGVEMSISLIANALTKRGYEVEILSIYNLGKPVYELDSRVKITYLTDLKPNKEEFKEAVKSKKIIKAFKEGIYALKVLRQKKTSMIKMLKSIEEGTVLSTRNEHTVLLSKYAKDNIKKVAQLHHDHEFKEELVKDFQNNYKNIDVFVLLTDLLRDEVEEMLKGHNSKTKCICIPNFLENKDIKTIKKEKQVIAVGRLHPVKGFDRLIDIWFNISKHYSDWTLKIVGGGEEEMSLMNKITELNLSKSVVLTGPLSHEETLREMGKSSVFAMTSFSEGFPFVLIESFMESTPVVAFNVRVGPKAIVEDGKEGYLVPDKDMDGYEKALISLIENKELREEFSRNAKEKSKKFMEDNIIEKWIDIL